MSLVLDDLEVMRGRRASYPMNSHHKRAPHMRKLEVEIFNTRFTVWEPENAAYLEALAA